MSKRNMNLHLVFSLTGLRKWDNRMWKARCFAAKHNEYADIWYETWWELREKKAYDNSQSANHLVLPTFIHSFPFSSAESRHKKALLLQYLSCNSAWQALMRWHMEGDKDWTSLLFQRSGGKSGTEWRLWVSSSQGYCHLLTIRAFQGPRKLLSGQKWFPL